MENIQKSSFGVTSNLHSNKGIHFIDDEDSRMILTLQRNKIIELQSIKSDMDKELSLTAQTVEVLFVQVSALQRHTLRRHLKVCKNMIKDLSCLVKLLNEETVPFRSLIEDELQLWTQELEKTYQQILKLKAHFLESVTRGRISDYFMIKNTPFFTKNLKNTRSVLHDNFEQLYKHLFYIHKVQKLSTLNLEEIIRLMHKVSGRLIIQKLEDPPIAINHPFGTDNIFSLSDNLSNPLNNFVDESTNTSDLFDVSEENLPPQQPNEDDV